MRPCLGIDFGNVVIDHIGFRTTDEFVRNGDYNLIPPVPGVMEALRTLNAGRFKDSIFCVYNATQVADQKIKEWLHHHRFTDRTGIQPEVVMRTLYGRDKWPQCKRFGATHFVDDRAQVLRHLVNRVPHLYLFRPTQSEVGMFAEVLPHVTRVENWSELLPLLA